jgi:hypothetical protein
MLSASFRCFAAQAKFEKVLDGNKEDPYARLSMGNIWLDFAQITPKADKKATYLERAFDYYQKVLLKDPINVYAAHGIGCVFALQGRCLRFVELS